MLGNPLTLGACVRPEQETSTRSLASSSPNPPRTPLVPKCRNTPNILSREFDDLSDKRLKCDSPMTSGGGFTWCQPVLKMPVSPVHLRESPLKLTNEQHSPAPTARGCVLF